jgi:hypothetical protein
VPLERKINRMTPIDRKMLKAMTSARRLCGVPAQARTIGSAAVSGETKAGASSKGCRFDKARNSIPGATTPLWGMMRRL